MLWCDPGAKRPGRTTTYILARLRRANAPDERPTIVAARVDRLGSMWLNRGRPASRNRRGFVESGQSRTDSSRCRSESEDPRFPGRKSLPSVSWDKPHRTGRGGQAALKRSGLGLADAVGRRFAYRRADDDIALAQHRVEVCARRPPCVYLTAHWHVRLSAPQVAVVREGEHFAPATFTGHDVRQVIRHHGIANAEQPGNPFAR